MRQSHALFIGFKPCIFIQKGGCYNNKSEILLIILFGVRKGTCFKRQANRYSKDIYSHPKGSFLRWIQIPTHPWTPEGCQHLMELTDFLVVGYHFNCQI